MSSSFVMKKGFWGVFFLVVAFGVGYFFVFLTHGNNLFALPQSDRVDVAGDEMELSGKSVKDIVGMPETTVAPLADKMVMPREIRTLAGTAAEAEIVRKWEESRGRFDEESLKDYAAYNLETLKSLVETGDVKAMVALARLYISDQYSGEFGVKYSIPLLRKAAIHGSSYAMELYAIQFEVDHFVNRTSDHKVLLEALSWNNAAALRGDLHPNNSASLNLRRKNIQLNSEDINTIRKRSEEIYQQLLSERRAIGLGDFDDSVPEEVTTYFSYFENYMDEYP